MKRSDLTIVTIVKDYSEGLKRTIQSVRSQKVDDSFTFEHIFCDGGSQASEFKLIMDMICDDSKIVSRSDSGIYSGMNKGLEHISSGWVLFLNAGDTFLASDSLLTTMRVLKGSKSGFLQLRSRYDDGIDRPQTPYSWLSLYLGFSMHIHPSVFFRREVISDICFDENLRIAGDLKFMLQAMKIHNLEFSSESVTRFEGNGVSSTQIDRMLEEMGRVRLDLKPFCIPKVIVKIWNHWTSHRTRYLRRKFERRA